MYEIFTDSASNLSPAVPGAEELNILPLRWQFRGEDHEGTEGFEPAEFYRALRGGEPAPTAMVCPAVFAEGFRSALEKGRDVLYIGLSSALSGSFAAAESAAAELREEFPTRQILLLDSLSASLGEGMTALYALSLRRVGTELMPCAEAVRRQIGTLRHYLAVEDLGFLSRTGRISSAVSLVGGALNIRVLLEGRGGLPAVAGRGRSCRRMLEMMADRWQTEAAEAAEPVYVTHADNEPGAALLLEALRERGFRGECLTLPMEPVTGSHVGSGTTALFFRGNGEP